MNWFCRHAMFGVAVCGFLATNGLADPAVETIQDRVAFLPKHKHQPLPGKVIGLLVADPQPVLSTEGRSGALENLCFARGLHSYRWVYVPTPESPQITNLRVKTADGGEQMYPALNMANPRTVTPWGVTQPYSLVEVEVNSGKGSPADMSFVGTSFKVLDGTKEFPLKATQVVNQLKKSYADWQKDHAKKIDGALAEVQKSALKDKKPTGPREKSDLLYLTWLPESQRILAHFKTRISDGSYTEVQGGVPFPPRPLPLPPGKGKVKGLREAPRPMARPARPGFFKVKVGTTFGVEFGMAYEVDKDGKVVKIEHLPIQSFTQVIQPPPGIGPRPVPLPPRPLPLPVEPAPKDR